VAPPAAEIDPCHGRPAARLGRRGFLRLSGAAPLAMLTAPPRGGLAAAQPGPAGERAAAEPQPVTLFLCGDVMTGRGIDQVLPHPGSPRICEAYASSAKAYVSLAEAANGPIPKPADFAYIWGDALAELARRAPDLRIVNLETAVTKSEDCTEKGISYRMSPENLPCLTAAGIDCCALANNHVLDWGPAGLLETLASLERAGIAGGGGPGDPARPKGGSGQGPGAGLRLRHREQRHSPGLGRRREPPRGQPAAGPLGRQPRARGGPGRRGAAAG
jgi:hypothetical protein